MMKTTERFQRALKDLNEVRARGGLAQDTKMKEKLETEQAMIAEVIRIGKEDGMTNDEVKAELLEIYAKPAVGTELENLTLYGALRAVLYDLDPDKLGAVDNEQITADFPHDKEFAARLLTMIHQKYQACTEEERRKITRSDAEFTYIVGNAIALRCGFKDINPLTPYGHIKDLVIKSSLRILI
jgi:hypothetical protein